MPSSDFTKDELVTKGNNTYPVVGGRLRLAHDHGLRNIDTEPIHFDSGVAATVKAVVRIDIHPEGSPDDFRQETTFQAHGTASKARDGGRMEHTLLELAETRAVARALRYAGFGVEFTGAEEVSHTRGDSPSGKGAPARAKKPRDPGTSHALHGVPGKGSEKPAFRSITDEETKTLSAMYAKAEAAGVDVTQMPNAAGVRNNRQFEASMKWLQDRLKEATA